MIHAILILSLYVKMYEKSWERAIHKTHLQISILNKNEFDNEKKNRFHGRTDFGASRFV